MHLLFEAVTSKNKGDVIVVLEWNSFHGGQLVICPYMSLTQEDG